MTDTTTQNTDIQQPQQPNADPAATGENKGKLFTQDEVNRIVSERLNREREKAAQATAQTAEPAPDDDIARRRAELTAAENRVKCKEFLLDNKQYPAALLDLYDTTDFEAFKANAEKLLKAFPKLRESGGIRVNSGPFLTYGDTGVCSEPDPIASVFKPKF